MYTCIHSRLFSFFISCVLLFSLLGCSDGGGSSNDISGTGSDDFADHSSLTGSTKSTDVSGVVSGGLISNALVIILAPDNQGIPNLSLGSTYTDSDGSYTVGIPAEYSGAIEVLIRANNKLVSAATMVCDALPDCGSAPLTGLYDVNKNGKIDFGEKFELPINFEMRAVSFIESDNDFINLSVTPMSSLAAAVAEQSEQGLGELSINKANALVASLLGIDPDFNSFIPADITSSLVDADFESLVNGIWSGAFLALASDVKKVDYTFKKIENNFVINNGQWLMSDENQNQITFADLILKAIIIAEELMNQNEGLTDFKSYLLNKLALALASEGEFTSNEVSPGFGLSPEQKVDLYLEDLVLVSEALDLSDLNSFGFSSDVLSAQESMLSGDTISALLATGKYALALSLVPDIASNEDVLPYICTFVTGFAGSVCSSVAEEYTLAEICEDDIKFMGFNICNMIQPYLIIEIPTLEENLTATFNILSREVVVSGTVSDQDVDLTITAPELYSGENIVAVVKGDISNAYESFNVQGQFEIDMSSDEVKLSDIANLSSDKLGGFLVLAGTGRTVTLSLGETSTYSIGFESMLDNAEMAQVLVMGTLLELEPIPESVNIEYSGRLLEVTKNVDDSILNVINQDGVEGEFYLDLAGDGQFGAIFKDNVLFSEVMREGDIITTFDLDDEIVDISLLFQ